MERCARAWVAEPRVLASDGSARSSDGYLAIRRFCCNPTVLVIPIPILPYGSRIYSAKLIIFSRYRDMPPFGRSIRRFHHNVSNMARRTAHDFEDTLQCAIPAFDLLFPEPHNTIVMKLLFLCAQWHAYAKLRLHTEVTLKVFENLTMELGDQFRMFVSETCAYITAYELDREAKDRQNKGSKAREPGQRISEPALRDSPTVPPPSTTASFPSGVSSLVNQASPLQSDQRSEGTSSSIHDPRLSMLPAEGEPSRSTEASSSVEFQFHHCAPASIALQASVSQSDQRESPGSSGSGTFTALEWQPFYTATDYHGGASSAHRRLATGASGNTPPAHSKPIAHEDLTCHPNAPSHQPSIKKLKKLVKHMNLGTPKFHALGHYPEDIPLFGTTDSYTTEICEEGHKHPKGWFKSTAKRYIRFELSRHERRRARLRALRRQLKQDHPTVVEKAESDARKADIHHSIGGFSKGPILLPEIIYSEDPGHCDFVCKLKRHLLPRILMCLRGVQAQDLPTLLQYSDWTRVSIPDQQLHPHSLARIKYTTYDVRRDEDLVHLTSDRFNIMLRNHDYKPGVPGLHPFRYAKVIGIYHANVSYIGPLGPLEGTDYTAHRLDLLCVRWYEVVSAESPYHLDQVRFLDIASKDAIDFVDPGDVLRVCHIVPRFSQGMVHSNEKDLSAFLGNKSDWNSYFIMRFSDRDMHMRYQWGLAVGHKYTHQDALGVEQVPTYKGSSSRDTTPFEVDGHLSETPRGPLAPSCSSTAAAHSNGAAHINPQVNDSMVIDDDDDDGNAQADDDWDMEQLGFLGAMEEVDDEREREFELFACEF
ncbi:hypothetical protein BKA70DRAFT_1461914 [Coprinopsis sp. MPI-PUGE-AT-0042]|nr:hypothetical protein BKA70DRAFT_1461914 [Coprinopsis sp. MPI-PUGE-AT-0042]